MSSPEKSAPYKVVVFGSGGVGKSSITLRFVTDTFSAEYLPTIEDCYRKQCVVDGTPAFLDILDTAGQEEYSALRDQWVREGDAFLLVYSITSRTSYDEIEAFRERILLVNDDATVPMVLVANKCDMQHERQVTYEQGQALARACGGIPFVECSALKSLNCDRVFYECVRETRRIQQQQQQATASSDPQKKPFFCTIL